MTTATAPTPPTRSRGAIVPKPAIPPTPPPRRPGLDAAALAELRNAGATYDFLRRKGDPTQFWETLRLARNRRSIVAPAEGEIAPPAPEVEAGIVHELNSMRQQFAPLVRDLRAFLKKIPGLPEPSDRLEMALAFLLVSAREHQAIARWLAEPGKHEAKAAEKLRSLAAITDPYREALQPWSLQVSDVEARPAEPREVHFAEIEPAAPAPPPRPPAPTIDPKSLETLRQAMECREILSAIHLESELWEMMLVARNQPRTTLAVLEQLSKPLEGDLLQQARSDGLAIEALVDGATELRGKYGEWVRHLRTFLKDGNVAPEDPRAFDVGFALMLATRGAQDRLGCWLEDPSTWQEEVLGLLGPWMRRGQDYLAALKA